MIQLGDLMVILDLHRQGLSISAIARRTARDPKTIRKYIARGLEPPAYGPRQAGRPGKLTPYLEYLRERIAAFPELTAVRLTRELRERGYNGAYTAVKRFAAAIRPDNAPKPFEVRFETPAGQQAQVDFARFVAIFADERDVTRIIWLFSMVLGHSRFIFARFVMHQDLQTLLRCHMQAFAAIGGVPIEILYDRMKTAVTGEDGDGHIVYNRSLLALAQHYGFHPRACRPYRAKTKGKVERPFSYIRQDGRIVAEHPRSFGRVDTVYDPWHYVPVLARKPGALRNGAPFKDWVLPAAIEHVRRKLAGADDGNRQMVDILNAVLTDGLPAVEAACAEAIAHGVHSADVVLNILARQRDPGPAVTILTPAALTLRHAPVADCARYDNLRRTI